jgi:hypothetical protein
MTGSFWKQIRRTIPEEMQRRSRLVLGAALAVFLGWCLAPVSASMGQVAGQIGRTAAPPRPDAWKTAAAASTGLAVGNKIPPFQLRDQNGRLQDFNSIRGPKGAAIYFLRSADW